MSDLTFLERSQLENLFGMGGGYVLDFSNRTFQEFVADSVGLDIDDPKYSYASGSKANRLRQFWKTESNHTAGRLIEALIAYSLSNDSGDEQLAAEARKIASRLKNSAPVPDIGSIQAIDDDRAFKELAKTVRKAIAENEPEKAIDRLHTFVVKLIRKICKNRQITVDRSTPLHGMFGQYVKRLKKEGEIESDMAERILKSSIQNFEAFNHVRNNQSYAHDNPTLGYEESLLIFNHVCTTVRFVLAIENRAREPQKTTAAPETDELDGCPF